ncbi:unnamed protein product [Mytilus edulis]|uniref:CABIT domain-containing protein n=1 Tax=Mytilus edulis TaxID=6550 RepID=A0A8S3U3I3_MYTED|nr:unnamed protein product [Mytilus edulis]
MTSKEGTDEDIVWSDETQSIRDVVYSSMPAIVRVAEGFYGDNDAESFSRGDLLKLDFVKSIQKVYATVVSSWSEAILEDRTGYIQPDREIIIPLGYKGKVVITRPPTEFKVYTNVTELMRDFPRYVRVDTPFFAQSNQDQAIRIESGKRLELDRFLPNQGLIAKYDDDVVVLNNSVKGRFVPLPDETEYTLTDVIDKLPLPQFVRFVEDEFEKVLTTDLQSAVENVQAFTGCVKLKRVFREEVVVGHHKPQLPYMPESLRIENEKYVHRSIVLLPLSRDAVNEIEVNVPIYSEPDEYELLAVRNFSQTSPNMDVIDGSLYLEFAKNPRSFYVIDDTEGGETKRSSFIPEAPPPVPPRPGHHIEVERKAPIPPPRPSVSDADDDREDYEVVGQPMKPPVIAPRITKQHEIHQNQTIQVHKTPGGNIQPSEKGKQTLSEEEVDGPLLIYEVPDDSSGEYIALPQQKHKISVPKPFYKRLMRVQSELKARLLPKSHHAAKLSPISPTIAVTQPLPSPTYDKKLETPFPSQSSPRTKTRHKPPQSPSTQVHQEKPSPLRVKTADIINLPPKPRGKKVKPVPPIKDSHSKPAPITTDSNPKLDEEISDEEMQDYDYPDISKMLPMPPSQQSQNRPVVRVQPSTRNITSVTTSSERMSQMSVQDVVRCLHQCALAKLANLCDENAIDGKFLSDLKDEELRDKPFSLNNIEVAKLKKMKEGWRPKID